MLPTAGNAAPAAPADERLLALAAALRAAHAREVDAVGALMRAEATGNGSAVRRAAAAADAAFDARTALMHECAALPARGLAGLAAKAALVCRALSHGATAADGWLASSLAADVARLAPDAAAEDAASVPAAAGSALPGEARRDHAGREATIGDAARCTDRAAG